MGISARVFFVRENESVQKCSMQTFNGLVNGDPGSKVPELADQRVKYVLVILAIEHRRPVAIRHVDCSYLQFNRAGRLDKKAIHEGIRAAIQVIDVPSPERHGAPDSLLHGEHLFARRAFKHRYKWTPSNVLLDRIAKLIFSNKEAPPARQPPRPGPRPV